MNQDQQGGSFSQGAQILEANSGAGLAGSGPKNPPTQGNSSTDETLNKITADLLGYKKEAEWLTKEVKDTKTITWIGFLILIFMVLALVLDALYEKERTYVELLDKVNLLESQIHDQSSGKSLQVNW